jgi:hypothetical protein
MVERTSTQRRLTDRDSGARFGCATNKRARAGLLLCALLASCSVYDELEGRAPASATSSQAARDASVASPSRDVATTGAPDASLQPAARNTPRPAGSVPRSEQEFGSAVDVLDAASPSDEAVTVVADAGSAPTPTADDDAGVAESDPTAPEMPTAADGCSRERLIARADAYLDALARGDVPALNAHANVRYTENGQTQLLGLGLWLEQPRSEFARHAADEAQCSSVTEAVLSTLTGRVVFAVRLRYIDDRLLEVEAHIARSGAPYFEPDAIIPSGPDPWLEPLAPEQRSSAAALTALAMRYFDSTADASLLPAHEPECVRRQNGRLMDSQGSCAVPPGPRRFEQLRYAVTDETTGVVALVVKYGDYIGFYLLKQRAMQLQAIEVIGGASAATTGW